jgi:hypothetical protein
MRFLQCTKGTPVGNAWSDQTIVTMRQSLDERIIYCFVVGSDRNMKETFAVRPSAGSDSGDAGREALKTACTQMQGK